MPTSHPRGVIANRGLEAEFPRGKKKRSLSSSSVLQWVSLGSCRYEQHLHFHLYLPWRHLVPNSTYSIRDIQFSDAWNFDLSFCLLHGSLLERRDAPPIGGLLATSCNLAILISNDWFCRKRGYLARKGKIIINMHKAHGGKKKKAITLALKARNSLAEQMGCINLAKMRA